MAARRPTRSATGSALRTFDGTPELHWDVTSEDMPLIERFTTTVRAPQGVTQGHCYVGDRDCTTTLDAAGVATLSGTEAAVGETITVATALPAGSVTRAEPRLESPLSMTSAVTAIDATATVHPDGSMTVEQVMDWVFPRGRAQLSFALPGREPWSAGEDLVRSYTGVELLLDGRPLELDPYDYSGEWSSESVRLTPAAPLPDDLEQANVVLRYTVTGAVTPESDAFALEWPLGNDFTEATRGTVRFALPAAPSSADCLRSGSSCTQITADVSGSTVTYTLAGSPTTTPVARIAWPRGAFPGLALPLEPSLDAARDTTNARDFWAGLGGLAAVGALGFLLGRRRRLPAQRYADTPPGVVDAQAAVTVDRGVAAPVLAVGLLLTGATALLRHNQFVPIPTATLTADAPLDLAGWRFRLITPLERTDPPPSETWELAPFELAGTTWWRAQVEAEVLDPDVVTPGGCSMEFRSDRGRWASDIGAVVRLDADGLCPSAAEGLAPGTTGVVTGYFRVPDTAAVNPRVVMMLPGLPARAFVLQP